MAESSALWQDGENDFNDEKVIHWLNELMDNNPERVITWMKELGLF